MTRSWKSGWLLLPVPVSSSLPMCVRGLQKGAETLEAIVEETSPSQLRLMGRERERERERAMRGRCRRR